MSVRSILGKSAALACSLALVSAFVYHRGAGNLLFSVRTSEAHADSDKRMPWQNAPSPWDSASVFGDAGDSRMQGGFIHPAKEYGLRTLMPDPKSSGVVDLEDLEGLRHSPYATEIAPSLGLPDIPWWTTLPQQMDLLPQP